jgi:hypothetical protein
MSSFLLLIPRHHLHPNFRQPQGLQMQERPDQLVGALPLEEEDAKQGIGDPAYRQVSRMQRQRITRVELSKV